MLDDEPPRLRAVLRGHRGSSQEDEQREPRHGHGYRPSRAAKDSQAALRGLERREPAAFLFDEILETDGHLFALGGDALRKERGGVRCAGGEGPGSVAVGTSAGSWMAF